MEKQSVACENSEVKPCYTPDDTLHPLCSGNGRKDCRSCNLYIDYIEFLQAVAEDMMNN